MLHYELYESASESEKEIYDELDAEYTKLLKSHNSYCKYFNTLVKWKKLELSGKRISDYCEGKRIAIYGAGIVGELLYESLSNDGIDIQYIIDAKKQPPKIEDDIQILTADEVKQEVDCVIVSITPHIDNVESTMKKLEFSPQIVTIDDICELLMEEDN